MAWAQGSMWKEPDVASQTPPPAAPPSARSARLHRGTPGEPVPTPCPRHVTWLLAAAGTPRVCEGGVGSHHGQLGLQLLHPVVLEVQLGAQRRGMVRGLLGLAPQLPLFALQQVLLLRQSFDSILALLRGQSARPLRWGRRAFSWP